VAGTNLGRCMLDLLFLYILASCIVILALGVASSDFS
jgi:hypothetical protein